MNLVVRVHDNNVAEYEVPAAGLLNIGRQPDVNDVVVNDIKASRRHGRLESRDGRFYFEDLGSGNGTIVDGQPAAGGQPIVVTPGVEIRIGETVLVLVESDAVPADSAPAAAATAQPVPEGKTGALECTSGALQGKSFGLGDRSIFLGRVPACHIQIDSPLASRRNTEILLADGSYRIRDLASSNGTFVNDAKVTEAPLRDGDEIRVADAKFRFSFVEAAGAPAVPTPQTMQVTDVIHANAAASSATGNSSAPAANGAGPSKSIGAFAGIAAVAVLLIGGGIYFATSGDEPKDAPAQPAAPASATEAEAAGAPVRIGKLRVLDIPVVLEKTANVRPAKQAEVALPVGSKVDAVHVQNQQRVKQGDKLVTLERSAQLDAALTEARAAAEQARQAVAKAELEVTKAETAHRNAVENLAVAQEAYDRNKPIYDAGNILQTNWDKIRTTLNDARAAVEIRKQEQEQAQRSVEQAREKVVQAEARVKDVSARHDDLAVTAKTDGVIQGLDLKKGYTITPDNQGFAIIEYEQEVKVVADIPEEDIVRIKPGMAVETWLPRDPQTTLSGTVTLVPPVATQRSYPVEMLVANRDQHLRPGAQAMVRFRVDTLEKALAAPSTALCSGNRGGFFLFVYDAATAAVRRIEVQRGPVQNVDGVEWVALKVSEGALTSETDIVTEGHLSLQDGAKVRVLDRD